MVLVTLACGDLETAAPPAAVSGVDTLSARRLADWLVLGQPMPVTQASADGLASHWADMATVAGVDPALLRSREAGERTAWPEMRAILVDRYLSDVVSSSPPAPEDVEDAFQGDDWRLVAHILRRAAAEAHPEERTRQREAAESIRTGLTRGTSWEAAVRQSEDAESLPRNGLLGLVEPGTLPPALDRTVFSLRPGEISTVVESPDGYHVIYRPRLDDVRDIARDLIQQRRVGAARAAHVAELSDRLGLQIASDGAERLRALAAGVTSDGSGAVAPLASWMGGALDDSVAVRYLGTLDEPDRRSLSKAPADDVSALLVEIAEQEMLWTVVVQNEPDGREVWDTVLDEYEASIRAIYEALGVPGADVAPGVDAVNAYVEAVVSRRRSPENVSPVLASWLRERAEGGVSPEGVEAAVDRATRLLRSAESDGPR